MKLKYNRILLKISGEMLAGAQKFGFNFETVLKIGETIKKCIDLGVQIGIVVGGGNFWRGRRSNAKFDKVRADQMGMLATVINSLGIAEILQSLGLDVRVQTAITMLQLAEPYIRNKAICHLNNGRVVIFGCGTGNPFFSTDTAAALRAAEIGAQIIFKASNVDGVYSSNPNENPYATKHDIITYDEILNKKLAVIDSTAASLCRDNNIPMIIFSLEQPENVYKALTENIGTLVQR